MDPDKKSDVNYRKSMAHKEIWKTRSKQLQASTVSSVWATRNQDTVLAIANKISKTLLNKTSEQRAETARKRHETELKRPLTICPHCGKVSKGLSNMKRYHLDKCKFKVS
jgi:ribosomal protein L32